MGMHNLLRDVAITFAIGGVFGAGVAIAYGRDVNIESTNYPEVPWRRCRAPGTIKPGSKRGNRGFGSTCLSPF